MIWELLGWGLIAAALVAVYTIMALGMGSWTRAAAVAGTALALATVIIVGAEFASGRIP